MNLSVEQRRLLQALGHDLMAHGIVWPAAAPAAAPMPIRASAAAPGRVAPAAPAHDAPRAAAPVPTARLLEALRRAANGADVAALAGDLERLRREPALKRALWPRLRALRRSH